MQSGETALNQHKYEDAVDAFNKALGSIPREVGIEQPPDFFPAHTFVAK